MVFIKKQKSFTKDSNIDIRAPLYSLQRTSFWRFSSPLSND